VYFKSPHALYKSLFGGTVAGNRSRSQLAVFLRASTIVYWMHPPDEPIAASGVQ